MVDSRATAGKVQDEPGTSYDAKKLKSAKPTKEWGHVKRTQEPTNL